MRSRVHACKQLKRTMAAQPGAGTLQRSGHPREELRHSREHQQAALMRERDVLATQPWGLANRPGGGEGAALRLSNCGCCTCVCLRANSHRRFSASHERSGASNDHFKASNDRFEGQKLRFECRKSRSDDRNGHFDISKCRLRSSNRRFEVPKLLFADPKRSFGALKRLVGISFWPIEFTSSLAANRCQRSAAPITNHSQRRTGGRP